MINGLGVDVFEVSRMEQALREGDADFVHGLFTPEEIAYCQRQHDPARHFAARFALKEAVLKALSLTSEAGTSWRDVELCVDADGDPSVALHGRLETLARERGVDRVLFSLTHTRELAIAGAILESRHDRDLREAPPLRRAARRV